MENTGIKFADDEQIQRVRSETSGAEGLNDGIVSFSCFRADMVS